MLLQQPSSHRQKGQSRERCRDSDKPFACRHKGAVHVQRGQLGQQRCFSLHAQLLIRRLAVRMTILH